MTTAFKASAVGFEMGNNKINSSDRFIRKVANPANKTLDMCDGPSIDVNTAIVGSSSILAVAWRWRVNTATKIGRDNNCVAYSVSAPDGFNTGIDGAV